MAVIDAGRCPRARNIPVNNPDRQVGRSVARYSSRLPLAGPISGA
jgi:hypothetical protein